MIFVDTKKIQLRIKNLEFDVKANSNYLEKNPELKDKIVAQIKDLKEIVSHQ